MKIVLYGWGILPLLFLIFPFSAFNQSLSFSFDTTMTERVIDYCHQLSEMGPRPAGSLNEQKAAGFILNEFKAMNIESYKEPFKYDNFQMDSSSLKINGICLKLDFLAFNPYNQQLDFNEDAILVKSFNEPSNSVENQCVITDNPVMHFVLMNQNPKLVVCISPDDFNSIDTLHSVHMNLRVWGKTENCESSNLVALIGGPRDDGKEILVTAHYDAYQDSPGANDNGTGVGGVLELARILKPVEKDLPVPVRFVIFGVEENGMVGSRVYAASHSNELKNYLLDLNLDTFGGNEAPVIACDKKSDKNESEEVKKIDQVVLPGKALEAFNGNWRIQQPEIFPLVMSNCYPVKLAELVQQSVDENGISVRYQHLMSDHLVFASAGIPALSIQSKKHSIHSPNDTFDKLNRESISKCMHLTLTILENVFNQIDSLQYSFN